MKSKTVFIVVALAALVSIMLLSTVFDATGQTPSPQGKAVKLKMTHYMPITHPVSKAVEQWAANIITRTNNR
jgi:TRAP-type C4-dicarboxylate transport system substrate-binding protein